MAPEAVTDEDLIAALLAMRHQHPDWRFGQMVCNVAGIARGFQKGATWDVEDSELIATIHAHLAQGQRPGPV